MRAKPVSANTQNRFKHARVSSFSCTRKNLKDSAPVRGAAPTFQVVATSSDPGAQALSAQIGRIGTALGTVTAERTPLQRQTARLVSNLALLAFVLSLALVLATAAVVMSVVKLAEPAPVATTTTVTAAPVGPTFTPDQVAAAKKQACDAVDTADGPITSSQRDFYAARLDRNSPQYQQMLSNWQTVSAVEAEYTRGHLTPATPPAVADAINADLGALAALVDGNTRGVSDDQANILIDKYKATGAQVTKVCEE